MTRSDPPHHNPGDEEHVPDSPPFWSFVPIGEYQVPGLPTTGAIADAWASFKRLLRKVDQSALQPARDEAKLRALPEVQLEHLAPPIDPTKPTDALDAALYDWLHGETPDWPVRFVINQPHAHPDLLDLWAARHGATVIEPPTIEQILAGDLDWFDQWPVNNGAGPFWVLPQLAHCYLRHTDGLKLVRALLARADAGELGRGVIGCDSWAWAYLMHIWPVPHAGALTAQAFDGQRLTRLLTHQIKRRAGFRNAKTGREILTVPSDDIEVHPEIVRLAAHTRGNPGTALTYWRRSLRTEPHEDLIETTDEPASGDVFDQEDVWVSAHLNEPVMTNEVDEDVALVLHAMLLHDGLPAALLPTLLPLTHDGCLAILLRLQRARLVECRDERWIVTATGYSSVRSLLAGRDYFTDGF